MIDAIIREEIDKVVSESDRHREGYWRERWARQKAEREKNGGEDPRKEYWKQRWAKQKGEGVGEEPKSVKGGSPKAKKKDRRAYYRKYNKEHPERLDRGFTKGFNNGNVSDGRIQDDGVGKEIFPGVRILGWDEFGMPITNDPLGDLLRNKEAQWHDDDWCEGSWDD